MDIVTAQDIKDELAFRSVMLGLLLAPYIIRFLESL